ncbi:hypothetical protein [Nostoc sp. JL33]|uniref:hypothetical protein n=1 Tax=Nostoc sp. JL33 TaxID=2815396 RepID=UPI0025CD4D12|nr:hypothetical protein [Nostoc sp. JL33]MBN3869262.1 hypothetical protein [Nostoc sp. JL33]
MNNQPQLVRSLITNTPYGKLKPTHVSAILAEIFKPKPETAAPVNPFIAAQQLNKGCGKRIQEQESQIATFFATNNN